jgi:hypothetical protein
VLAWAVHLPVWNDAKTRGYDRAFVGQYTGWLEMISAEFRQQVADLAENDKPLDCPVSPAAAIEPTPTAAVPPPVVPAAVPEKKPNADSWEDRGALGRAPLSDVICGRRWPKISFAISTYLPILISALAIIAGGLGLLVALVRHDPETKERILYPLTVLGCALTLFPQFFCFRPDTPHLSEMMVPYLAALALFVWASGRVAIRTRKPVARYAAGAFAALCVASGTIYFSHAFPKESSGSIAAKKMASHEFRALNGVSVNVRDREARWLAGLRDAVLQHSSPGENVLCLPYSPTINFMTDRPSPLYNLYVDNSTARNGFMEDFLNLINSQSPAVVVIDQRRINRNEASRFRNWAPAPYRWLHKNYVYFGRYFRNEVFVRKDKVAGPVTPEAVEVSD